MAVFMNPAYRISVLIALALAVVPFLPLYVQRTMTRSQHIGHVGDVIEWGWAVCTLSRCWSNYSYLRSELNQTFWLGVNLALAIVYAALIALVANYGWELASEDR
jgi:hypothetical protein